MTQSNRPVEDAFAASLRTSDLTDKQQACAHGMPRTVLEQGIRRHQHQGHRSARPRFRREPYTRNTAASKGLLDALLAPLATVVVPRLAKEFMGEIARNDSADFREFLDFIVRDRMAFAISNRQLIRIMIGRVLNDPQMLTTVLGQFSDAITETIEPILKRYQQAGQLVDWPCHNDHAYHRLHRHRHHDALHPSRHGRPRTSTPPTAEVVDFLVKGLSPGESR
jgi:hypothetical protein